jgi:hypothetical protein
MLGEKAPGLHAKAEDDVEDTWAAPPRPGKMRAELLWSLSLHDRNTRGSAMNFDPVLQSRIQFAWVIG